MKKKLLTIDDLYRFYSTKKKSMNFSADKAGYNIAVQVNGKFEVEQDDNSEGLLYGKIRAFHDLGNRNKSYIETDILEQYLPSMKDRPIMADIIEVEDENGNIVKDFNGHTMELDEENDKIVYIEKPVGHFVNPESFHLEWSEEYQRNFVMADAVIYEEYTDACDILRRREETDCSVELCIRDMSYDCKTHELHINNFYVQGCTLLGAHVQPGMAGSKLSLKDFSEENNSVFSNLSETEETNQKLIETLEALNSTLSKFNINQAEFSADEYSKEGGNEKVTKLEELMQKYNKTEADIEFETEGLSDEELESKFAEVFGEESNEDPTSEDGDVTDKESEVIETEGCKKKKCEEDDSEDNTEESEIIETEGCKKKKCEEDSEDSSDDEDSDESTEETDEVTETEGCKKKKCEEDNEDEEVTETEGCKKKKCEEETFETIEKTFKVDGRRFSVSFELSHEDIKCGLYGLLAQYEELDNDWYNIRAVYNDSFVFQGWFTNKIYGQKYTQDGNTVAINGERYELFEELLTATEKAELDAMRSNYSLATEKLAAYEKAELDAQKEEVLADANYAEFAETESFKKIRENIEKYSLDELKTAAELAFAKEVKAKGTFALHEEEKPKAPTMFAFGKIETKSSFLDGLLGK